MMGLGTPGACGSVVLVCPVKWVWPVMVILLQLVYVKLLKRNIE